MVNAPQPGWLAHALPAHRWAGAARQHHDGSRHPLRLANARPEAHHMHASPTAGMPLPTPVQGSVTCHNHCSAEPRPTPPHSQQAWAVPTGTTRLVSASSTVRSPPCRPWRGITCKALLRRRVVQAKVARGRGETHWAAHSRWRSSVPLTHERHTGHMAACKLRLFLAGPTSHVPTVLAEVSGRMPLTMPFFSGPVALLKPGRRGGMAHCGGRDAGILRGAPWCTCCQSCAIRSAGWHRWLPPCPTTAAAAADCRAAPNRALPSLRPLAVGILQVAAAGGVAQPLVAGGWLRPRPGPTVCGSRRHMAAQRRGWAGWSALAAC